MAAGTAAPPAGTRPVRVGRGEDGITDVAVHAGADLRPGHTLLGPALIDGSDTTIWIPAGAAATVDAQGTLDVVVAS